MAATKYHKALLEIENAIAANNAELESFYILSKIAKTRRELEEIEFGRNKALLVREYLFQQYEEIKNRLDLNGEK